MGTYRKPKYQKSLIKRKNTYEGESIETKIQRMMNNGEPMDGSGAALIYTQRDEGVRADTDIRTDRMEIAMDAMDVATKTVTASREAKAKMDIVKDKEVGGAEPVDGTDNTK